MVLPGVEWIPQVIHIVFVNMAEFAFFTVNKNQKNLLLLMH
jgi:hypothetical protein